MLDPLGLNDEPSISKLLRGFRDGSVLFSGMIVRLSRRTDVSSPQPAPASLSGLQSPPPFSSNGSTTQFQTQAQPQVQSTSKQRIKTRSYVFAVTDQALYLLREGDLSFKTRVLWSDVSHIQIAGALIEKWDVFSVSTVRPSNSLVLTPHADGPSKLEILASFPSRVNVVSLADADIRFPEEDELSDSDDEQAGSKTATRRHLVGSKRISKEALIENPYFAKKEEEMFTSGDGFLLANVVRTEFLTGTLQTVLERGKQKPFRELLGQFEELADQHIQSVCSDHYQTFLNAFSELPLIDDDCARLRSGVRDLNSHMQDVGAHYLKALESLQTARYVAQNLTKGLESVALCSRLAAMAAKVEQLVAEKKYYPALKSLYKLELQLPLHLSFGRFLANNIPRLRASIKATVLADFNEWLVQIREFSVSLGDKMLASVKNKIEQLSAEGDYWSSYQSLSHTLQNGASNMFDVSSSEFSSRTLSSKPRARSSTVKTSRSTPILENPNGSVNSTVDFSTLYTCSHVYQSLHEDDTFRNYYLENRRKQIELDLAAKRNSLQEYFSRIVGFFVIESRVAKSASHLMPAGEMASIWDDIIDKLKAVIAENLDKFKTSAEWITLKNSLVVFGMCLQLLSLHITPFFDFVESWKDRYASQILLPMFQTKLDGVLENDHYDFMQVANASQFDALVAKYNLSSEMLSKDSGKKWPISLSFSAAVPQLLAVVEDAVKTYLEFGRNLMPVDESAKRIVDELVRYIGHKYESILGDIAFSNILQCAIIGANCSALHIACSALEYHVSELLKVGTSSPAASHGLGSETRLSTPTSFASASPSLLGRKEFLTSRTILVQTRSSAEDFVFKSIMMKSDEFVSIGFNADWLQAAPPRGVSDHIEDLAQFIQTTFQMLEIVPRTTLASLQQRTAQHIAVQMLDVVVQSSVRSVTRYGIAQLDADLGHMELVFKSYSKEFVAPFTTIRNALAVLLTIDPEHHKNDQETRLLLLSHVSSAELVKKMLLVREKIRDPPKDSVKKSGSKSQGLFKFGNKH
eukprot:ANDGO_06925.mRNA.1 Exocyst complex component SEC15B